MTESALLKRVNRKLAHSAERLRRGRHPQFHYACYLLIDADINAIRGEVDDLESYARELGVLYGAERLGSTQTTS